MATSMHHSRASAEGLPTGRAASSGSSCQASAVQTSTQRPSLQQEQAQIPFERETKCTKLPTIRTGTEWGSLNHFIGKLYGFAIIFH